MGAAAILNSTAVTPEPSAVSTRRRLDVRSMRCGSRHNSITTVPKAEHRMASSAARNRAIGSGVETNSKCRGSMPISLSPCGKSDRSPFLIRNQATGPPISRVQVAAKPAAQVALSILSAIISCSLPRRTPPPRARSISAWPVGAGRELIAMDGVDIRSMRCCKASREMSESGTMFFLCSICADRQATAWMH